MAKAGWIIAAGMLALLGWANWPGQSLASDARATRVIVHKRQHILELYAGDRLLKTYPVSIGRGGLQPKQVQGDGRTPEGHYTLDSRNPKSSFHLALHVSYPSPADAARARAAALP